MKRSHVIGTIVLAIFLLATNRWIDYDDLPKVMDTPDVHDYMSMAISAPNLPAEPVLFHRAQRIAVPFFLGVLASITGLSHKTIFLLMALLCCGAVVLVFQQILSSLGLNGNAYFLCTSLLMLNPYVFRLYLTLPGLISDLVFVMGLAFSLLGLLKGKFPTVLTGVIVAAMARQTALLLLPGLLLWLSFGEGWKARSFSWKLFYSVAVVFSASVIYKSTAIIAARFAYRNMNLTFITGIFSWAANSFSIPQLAEFALRIAIPHMFAVCILGAAAIALRRKMIFRTEFWICVLLAACIMAQPLLGGPAASTGGVVRLSSFGFLPLLTALAMIAGENKIFDRSNVVLFTLLQILIAGASFHHVFSFIGGDLSNAGRFVLVYFMFAFAAGVICFFVVKPRVIRDS